MEWLLYVGAAVTAYLVAGWNPAITFSKAIYKKDIRTCGSGNPGFTNFKRTFGNRYAWYVLLLDLSKTAVVVAVFAWLFGKYLDCYAFGAAFTGVFAVLGHAFPVWYKFKGGKGFLSCMSIIWFLDWRAGVIALLVLLLLLLTTKYMSLATVVAMLTCPITLLVVKEEPVVVGLYAFCVLFMAWRHKENFKRLVKGTESKFSLKGKKHRGFGVDTYLWE